MEDNKTSGSQQVSQASGELWFACAKSQLMATDKGRCLYRVRGCSPLQHQQSADPLLKGIGAAKPGDKKYRDPNLQRS